MKAMISAGMANALHMVAVKLCIVYGVSSPTVCPLGV